MIKKTFFFILAVILMAIIAFAAYQMKVKQKYEGPKAPDTIPYSELIKPVEEISDDSERVLPQIPIAEDPPSTLNIEMPFYTQAPHANWDYPWQEACEEASILLVANLYNDMNLDLEAYNSELLYLVDLETEYFGSYEHTTAQQTAEILLMEFGLGSKIHDNPSFTDIQEILAKGHLIIAPFAGKLLENPNYLNGGPVYHMLVIKGYDANKLQIVTHDVGTKNGADYVYNWETIAAAMHDWHDEDILLGTPRIIEILP